MKKKQVNIQMDEDLYDFVVIQSKVESFIDEKDISISDIIRNAIKHSCGFDKLRYTIKNDKDGNMIGYQADLVLNDECISRINTVRNDGILKHTKD